MQFTSCSTERAERLKYADNDSMNELEENDVRRQLDGRLEVQVLAGRGRQERRVVPNNWDFVQVSCWLMCPTYFRAIQIIQFYSKQTNMKNDYIWYLVLTYRQSVASK